MGLFEAIADILTRQAYGQSVDSDAARAVQESSDERRRFDESRGYMRDHELRARDQRYAESMRSAPMVRYSDNTPYATERNNRSANVPVPLIERIVTSARSQGIDPYKALAIAITETNLGTADNSAYSLVNPLHKRDGRVLSQFDMVPESMSHIRKLEERFPNDQDKATRAYNGLGVSYIKQNMPYDQKVRQHVSSIMSNPGIVDIINNSSKR